MTEKVKKAQAHKLFSEAMRRAGGGQGYGYEVHLHDDNSLREWGDGREWGGVVTDTIREVRNRIAGGVSMVLTLRALRGFRGRGEFLGLVTLTIPSTLDGEVCYKNHKTEAAGAFEAAEFLKLGGRFRK